LHPISSAVGEALRDTRLRRRLTVYDVERLSNGRFKPSSLGGYERGERAISMQRFCELAEVYGVRADRLLLDALARAAAAERVVVDLTRTEVEESAPG
jgi:transcriptional regulator with XRE-family HTH domain